jgi:hypothetical protein
MTAPPKGGLSNDLESGIVSNTTITRLAHQVAANLDDAASSDDILRPSVGIALAHDLSDDQLQALLAEVDRLRRQPRELVA